MLLAGAEARIFLMMSPLIDEMKIFIQLGDKKKNAKRVNMDVDDTANRKTSPRRAKNPSSPQLLFNLQHFTFVLNSYCSLAPSMYLE